MKAKRILALCLSICMLLTMMPVIASAGQMGFSDFPTGWSNEAMTAAVNNGLLVGKSATEIKPEDNLTRAEFATIVTRAFGAKTVADISAYTDVPSDAWYYEYIAKAVKMEAMQGKSASTMDPEANITREEAFTALARVLVLESADYSSLSKFQDADDISDWAKPYLSAMAAKNYVNGDEKGYANPKANITREEFAQVMHNMIKRYITTPGTYAEVLPGITVVRCGGVNITGTVQGDLVIGDGAMTDAIQLSNVTIVGRLLTRGGTMTLKTTTTGEGVVVKNVNGVTMFLNYRTESVFSGIREITPAEFLKTGGTNFGSSHSGGTSKEKLYFYVDGEVYETIIVNYGSIIGDKLPDAPEREGYRFVGWYKNEAGTGDEIGKDTIIKNSFDVYAVWEAKTYDLKFEPDNGDPIITLTGTYDQAIGVLPAEPTKAGFTFGGWFDANGNQVDEFTVVKGAMQLTAKWNPVIPDTFTVTFRKGALNYAVISVTEGNTIGLQMPSDPTKEGHTFVKWVDENGNEVTSATVVTGNMIVNAVFAANEYTLTFDPDNGDATFDIDVTYGDTIGLQMPNDPIKTGHTFAGWVDQNGNPVTSATVVAGNMQITATWTANDYTLTFDPDNGDATFDIIVAYGQAIGAQMPADPVKSGWNFMGWEDQNGNPVNASTVVTEDLQITAQWEFIFVGTYTVTFMVDGVTYDTATFTDGSFIGAELPTNPVSTIPGNGAFLRWEDENGNLVTAATTVNRNMTVTAVFEVIQITVEFKADTTSPVLATLTRDYGWTLADTDVPAPILTGYEFQGWIFYDGTPVEYGVTQFTENVTLYAKWAPGTVSYTVKHFVQKIDGTYETITEPKTGTTGAQTAAEAKPEYAASHDVQSFSQAVIQADSSTVVEIYYNRKQFTVTFDANGGLFADSSTQKTVDFVYGEELGAKIPSNPSQAGFTFKGWEDQNGNTVTDATVVTDDLIVNAVFAANDYTLTFDPDNGDATFDIDVTYGHTIGLQMPTDPTKEGHTFAGWVDQNGNPVTSATVVAGNMQITATWTANDYTLTFDPDNGDATFDIDVTYGHTIGLQMPADPTKAGHTFLRWEDENGNAVTSTTVVTGNMQITATWSANDYTVTFDPDNGQATFDIEVTYGDTIGLQMPTDPSKAGHTFLRWEDENGNVVTSATVVYGDMEITAMWSVNDYTVTFDPDNGEASFSVTVPYGQAIGTQMPLDPEWDGYIFRGWEDADGNTVTSATVVTDNMQVIAIWEMIPANTFTVTFKVDGETYKTIVVADGDAIGEKMPINPVVTGKNFLRWEDEKGNVVDATYVVTEDVVANAILETQIFTVRFFNGAEAVDAKQLGDALSVEYSNNVLNADYPADAVTAAENVKTFGYTKKADWAPFYNNEKHEVYAQWMYVNPASGEWELFDESVSITQDTDVHLLLKRVFFMIENDRLPQAFQVQAHYVDGRDGLNPVTNATRLRDTGKDLSASFIKQAEVLLGEEFFLDNEEKIFNKLFEKGFITEDRQIKISKLPVKITSVISVDKIEGEVKQYIEDALADPAKLDSVLAMVDIASLIDTIGMDNILAGISDDTLYQLLTSSANRETVTNVIYNNLSNSAIKGEVIGYLKGQIVANESFRLELAENVSSTLIASLSDAQLVDLMKGTLKDTVIDYVVANATGTLKQTLIEFIETELQDTTSDFYADILTIIRTHLADDGDLRKEILSNRVLLETMLDFFEDEVIDIIANSDELIENAISQDNVRGQFLEELVESEHFMEEILAVHPEYLTKMVKDGGRLHLTAEDALESDTFKEDIFTALKADGEFANFFVAGSALQTVVADYVDDEKEEILDYIVLGTGDYSDYDALIDAAIASYGSIDDLRDIYALLPPADQQDAREDIWNNLRPEIIATAMTSFTDDTAAGAAFAEQALTSVMVKYLDKDLPAGIDEDVIDNVFVNYVNDALHNTNLDAEVQNLIDSVKTEVKDLSNGPLADMTSDELVDFVITYRNDQPDEVYEVLHISYQTVEDYVLDAITDETAATYDPDLYAAIDDMVADHADEVEDDVITSLINELLGHNVDLLDRYIEMLLNNPTELRGYVTLFVESSSFDEAFVATNRTAIVGTLSVSDYANILLELASDTDPASDVLISDLVDEFVGSTDSDTVLLIKDYIADFVENDLDVAFITANRATINTALVDADVSDLIDKNLIKEYVADVNARGETEALANQVYDYLKDLQYYKDFIAAFKNNAEEFEVTGENAVFASAIANAVENYTYEQIIEMVDNQWVDRIIQVLGEDFLKSMFNTATSDYAQGLHEVVEDVQGDGVARAYTTSIIFKANVVKMLNDLYVKAQLKAEEKLMNFPALRYDENVYLQYIVQHNPIEELLEKVGPETDELTGYKFKDAADTIDYLDYAQKMVVIADDAIRFYGDTANLSEAEIEALFDAIYGKADKVQAKINELLEAFAETGEMPDKIETVVNKVSKVNELLVRFEPQIDKVINIYLDSSFSDIGEDKSHKVYDFVLGIEEPVITVDFLYDLFYKAEEKGIEKLNEMIEDGTLEKIVEKYENTTIKEIVDRLGNQTASSYAEKLDEIKNSGRVQSAFDSLYDVVLMIADQGVEVFKAPANTNSKIIVVDAYQFNIRGVVFTIQRDMR